MCYLLQTTRLVLCRPHARHYTGRRTFTATEHNIQCFLGVPLSFRLRNFLAVFLPCEVPVRILGVQPVQSNACRASQAVRAVPGEVRALTFCRTFQRLSYFFYLCLLSILHTSGLLCKVCYRRLPAIGFL